MSETHLTMEEIPARPPLQFRRFGGGYKREDVELVFAEVGLTLRSLELELQTLRERLRELETQLREARLELEGARAKGLELARPGPTQAKERRPPAEEAPFAGRVELDAGPFEDFDSIAAFEGELARLPNVDDVYVVRIDGERAVIELSLAGSTPLVAEMRERLPYTLRVRAGDDTHLVVDVSTTAGAA